MTTKDSMGDFSPNGTTQPSPGHRPGIRAAIRSTRSEGPPLISLWERLGEGFRLKGENKETPAPIRRKRREEGFPG